MKRITIAAIVCIGLMSLIQACGHKPVDIVMAYQEALNAGDVDRAMSLYAEEAHFRVPGVFDLQGREALRGLAEYDRELHIVLEFGEIEMRGDTVFCQVKETNEWIETAGISELYYQGFIVVRRGWIETIEIPLTPESEKAYRRVMMPLMGWARAERPEQLAEMMPQDEFVYNAGNAQRSLSLLQDFKQNQQRQATRPRWKKLGE